MNSPVKLWRNQKRIQSLLGKEGVIVSWTIIFVPPGGFSIYAPYPLAIVALDNGQRITAQVVDYDKGELQSGQRIRTILRRVMEPTTDGVIAYGIKVTPI